jgi:hypothetical protein
MVSYNPVNLNKKTSDALIVHCCAFGKIDDEVDSHSKYLHLAEQKIAKELPQVKVVPHLLGAKQELKLKVPA